MSASTLELAQLNPEQILNLKYNARLAWAKQCAQEKDILGWGAAVMPEKFYLPFCRELHGYFVEIRGAEFTNTKAPRNHAKTIIKCVLIPLFQGIYEPETFKHYLNVQATGPKAQAVNVSIRTELELNPILKDLVGDLYSDRWTDMQFVLKNNVIYTAISAGQSIRGLHYNNIRPDYMLVDDLYDEEDINNPESTRKKNDWFMGSLYPARNRARRTSVHVQGTAINQDDLLVKLEKDPNVVSRTFAAIKDWANKIVLWPELNSFEMLEREMGIMGSHIFMREMQNQPRDEKTAIIKRNWLYPEDGSDSWEFDPAKLRFDAHHSITAVLLGVDPSIGKKMENDATGVALVLKTRFDDGDGLRYYIMGLWNERLSLDKRVLLLSDIAAAQPRERSITQARIEAISGFEDFASEVRRRTSLPVEMITFVKDKISTLESKSTHFENKRIFLNRNIDPKLKELLVDQLTINVPPHDDLRDGLLLTLDEAPRDWSRMVKGLSALNQAMGR